MIVTQLNRGSYTVNPEGWLRLLSEQQRSCRTKPMGTDVSSSKSQMLSRGANVESLCFMVQTRCLQRHKGGTPSPRTPDGVTTNEVNRVKQSQLG
jgi:hypothetical protein